MPHSNAGTRLNRSLKISGRSTERRNEDGWHERRKDGKTCIGGRKLKAHIQIFAIHITSSPRKHNFLSNYVTEPHVKCRNDRLVSNLKIRSFEGRQQLWWQSWTCDWQWAREPSGIEELNSCEFLPRLTLKVSGSDHGPQYLDRGKQKEELCYPFRKDEKFMCSWSIERYGWISSHVMRNTAKTYFRVKAQVRSPHYINNKSTPRIWPGFLVSSLTWGTTPSPPAITPVWSIP